MDVKELSQISGPPEKHWYYAAKFDLLASTVGQFGAQQVADVGAGSGVFARLLLERTRCREATCVDPAYDAERDESVNGKPLRFRRRPSGENFDLVLLMDVMEHVDDDVGLLADTASSLKSGTPLFITVPAFQSLWSAHDEFLDHRRRYTARRLARAITAAHLQINRIRYFYATILPPVAVLRLASRAREPSKGSDLRPTPAGVAWVLEKALAAERRLLYPFNTLGGLSVVAVARKV
jgi:SAM-dependent methyltransferase